MLLVIPIIEHVSYIKYCFISLDRLTNCFKSLFLTRTVRMFGHSSRNSSSLCEGLYKCMYTSCGCVYMSVCMPGYVSGCMCVCVGFQFFIYISLLRSIFCHQCPWPLFSTSKIRIEPIGKFMWFTCKWWQIGKILLLPTHEIAYSLSTGKFTLDHRGPF